MRTIIAGSRSITDPAVVDRAIRESGFNVSVVLCGCAKGVDLLGEKWAKRRELKVEHYPAEWTSLGNAAGPARNEKMSIAAEALIAIWDGVSRGTADMIRKAQKRGLKIFVYRHES